MIVHTNLTHCTCRACKVKWMNGIVLRLCCKGQTHNCNRKKNGFFHFNEHNKKVFVFTEGKNRQVFRIARRNSKKKCVTADYNV